MLSDNGMFYGVYQLTFPNFQGDYALHVALSVKLGFQGGLQFHAVDDPSSSTSEMIRMRYEEKSIMWDDLVLYGHEILLGRLYYGRLQGFRNICRSIPVPSRPQGEVEGPNGITWLLAAVDELLEHDILDPRNGS